MLWEEMLRDRAILDAEYENENWNPDSGLPFDALKEKFFEMERELANEPRCRVKPRLTEFLLDNARISVEPAGVFADRLNHGGLLEQARWGWQQALEKGALASVLDEARPLREARACTADPDFGHTCPDWGDLLEQGFPGILARLIELRREKPERADFYDGAICVWRAAVRYVGRLRAEVERMTDACPRLGRTAEALRSLENGAPKTFLEALQLMLLYYELHSMDGTVLRSMGGLDALLDRFYRADMEAGRLTEQDARAFLGYFFLKLRARHINANIPFYLCGVDRNGREQTNPLSFMILEVYDALDIQDPKIHIRCNPQSDPALIRLALRMIRDGHNSLVFINGPAVSKALERLGESPEDARDFAIVGCYEPMAVNREVPCTCNGRVNLPKAVELTLSDGVDLLTGKRLLPASGKEPASWEDFLARLREILGVLCAEVIEVVNAYERHYMELCPSPVYSSAMPCSREQGVDLYAGGAVYNSSSTNILGTATAADALNAIRRLCFEEKRLSLSELRDTLQNDWAGRESLRQECLSHLPKYGCGASEDDETATWLLKTCAAQINGRPNGRGGVHRMGAFSIDWRIDFGRHTAASADGRRAGEPLSKNISASLGGDRQGVTGLIRSASGLDYSLTPNGTVLDLVIHRSAADGEDGLNALYGLLSVFLNRGGFALHINVLDPEILRAAQAHPEQYRSLQVRLCGWNVYFVDLSRAEQDEFIRQSAAC